MTRCAWIIDSMCMDHRRVAKGLNTSVQVRPASLDVAYEKKSNALVLFEKKPASCAMSRANVQNTGLCAAMDV